MFISIHNVEEIEVIPVQKLTNSSVLQIKIVSNGGLNSTIDLFSDDEPVLNLGE